MVSGRVEIHLGLQHRFVPRDVVGIHWQGLEVYGKVWGAFQSYGIAPFRGIFFSFYSMFNDRDKAEQGRSAPSAGIPWSAKSPGQFCAHNQRFPGCWEMLWQRGRASAQPWCVYLTPCGHWIHTGTQLCCHQALSVPVPHVPVPGMEGAAQHRSVPQGESLCTLPAPPQHPLRCCQGCQSASSLEMEI